MDTEQVIPGNVREDQASRVLDVGEIGIIAQAGLDKMSNDLAHVLVLEGALLLTE